MKEIRVKFNLVQFGILVALKKGVLWIDHGCIPAEIKGKTNKKYLQSLPAFLVMPAGHPLPKHLY